MRMAQEGQSVTTYTEELSIWAAHLEGRLADLCNRPTVERMLSAQLAVASLSKVLGFLADCLITEGEGHDG